MRAKINEGCAWELTDPETGEVTFSKEDQIVTFTIKKQDPGPSPGPKPDPGPDTGDHSGLLLWLVLLVVSLLSILGMIVLRRIRSSGDSSNLS